MKFRLEAAQLRYAVVVSLTLLGVSNAKGQSTFLSLKSDPGDSVGIGQSLFFTSSDFGVFVAYPVFNNGVEIAYLEPHVDPIAMHYWTLFFDAPDHAVLQPGNYFNAMRWPDQPATHPGLSVEGDHRGCLDVAGNFSVLEIDYNAAGDVTRFWATFEQYCGGSPAALRGEVRYNIVPETSTLWLLLAGFAGCGFFRFRKPSN